MTNCYLTSLRYENYLVLRDNGFNVIGFNERSQLADKLKKGDMIFIYIGSRVSKIVGYVRVKQECYWDTKLLWDDIFPKRVRIEPISVVNDNNGIHVKNLVEQLSFVKNKSRYGMSFMAGLRQIPQEDATILVEQIESRIKNEL